MSRLTEWIRTLFTGEHPAAPEDLRQEFLARYHNFKLLLKANTQALEAMAEIESALQGRTPFGFAFIRSRVARVSVQVYSMIRHLDALAPGKYDRLFEQFAEITERIGEAVPHADKHVVGRMAVSLDEIDRNDLEECGGKMARLGELRNNMGLTVPDGFAVTAAACNAFLKSGDLQQEIDRLIQTSPANTPSELQILSSTIRQRIMESELPVEVSHAIEREYTKLTERQGEPCHMAVRSSALGEDEPGASFAGQYTSILNIERDSMLDAYKRVVASLYGVQAMRYRERKGLGVPCMCVGFLTMVDSDAGGVVYTRDPVSETQDAVLVNGVWGRPKAVVDGVGHVDRFAVDRESGTIFDCNIAHKDVCIGPMAGEGTEPRELSEEKASQPSLTDEQVMELASISLRIETQFGYPQDIEFAIDKTGRIVFLQTRGMLVTSARTAKPLPDGATVLFEGGVGVSRGVGTGPVHHVRKSADGLTFSGGVLVVSQPLPELAVLLPGATAVVAEQGGVAGHLATVAREFGIPALFQVAGAMELLKEGREITVDGDGLRILDGRVESLLDAEEDENLFMIGSPVHTMLETIGQHVTPLNLLEPEGVNFKPSACRTFHDITRFCHEKGVAEMFSFGRGKAISRYEAKQLHVDGRAKQFWVVNLQDGFANEPEDKWISIEDIRCTPMLALWHGMHARPWDGPPSVDGRGFLSVMFEASMNPRLNVGGGTTLAFNNYFLVSRDFCSLQSRFGFHFCSAEALAGEHAVENYAGFRFFGGAAGPRRRVRRVEFIRDLLEAYGFRIRTWEDSLAARIEGYDKEFTVSRLHVLGYVIMHTRQLDMIMENQSQVAFYRKKMENDMNELFDIQPMQDS